FYKKQDISDISKVDISLSDTHLQQALHTIFKDLPYAYEIKGKVIVVTPKKKTAQKPARLHEKIMILQQIQVRGIVRDTTGTILTAVTVAVKNQPRLGTSTDLNGRYLLSVPPAAILIFSMVGFESQEIPVSGKE